MERVIERRILPDRRRPHFEGADAIQNASFAASEVERIRSNARAASSAARAGAPAGVPRRGPKGQYVPPRVRSGPFATPAGGLMMYWFQLP